MRIAFYCLLFFFATLTSLTGQDSCQTAIIVEVDNIYLGDGYPSTQPPPFNCINFNNGTGFRWYSYTAELDTFVLITTALELTGTTDTRFHVLIGQCGGLSCAGGNDDNDISGTRAQTVLTVTAGTTYYIVFDNRWNNDLFAFSLSYVAEPIEQETRVSFTPVVLDVPGQEMGVTDMNGDFLDDVISTQSGEMSISIQNADGTFTQRMVTPTELTVDANWSLAIGDYDRNGFNDVVMGGGSRVAFLRANEDGTEMTEIAYNEYVFSQRTNFIDINNDGHLDCFVCHDVQPNVFYINDGENNLTFNQGSLGDIENGGNYGSIWVDFDNDGDQDMFIAKCRGGSTTININELHQNNGDGTFTEVAEQYNLNDPIQTWSAAWGDFDNDGDLDVFVGASSFADGRHKLMRNDGDTFTDITAGITAIEGLEGTSRETITHDFDNDGYLDIMGAGGLILMNNGDMTFTQSDINHGHGPMGDLNNDGFIDVVNSNRIFLNDGNDNNYLKINVIGTTSNINGIGARLEVHSALGKQIREITSGTGFKFMSSLNAHFGLGADEAVDSLVIRWPSGIVDVVLSPEINSTVLVTEGSTIISGVDNYNVLPLTVSPNPSSELLNLELASDGQLRKISVFNLSGRLVQTSNTAATQVNVSQFPAGTYILFVEQGDLIWRTKFVKQ